MFKRRAATKNLGQLRGVVCSVAVCSVLLIISSICVYFLAKHKINPSMRNETDNEYAQLFCWLELNFARFCWFVIGFFEYARVLSVPFGSARYQTNDTNIHTSLVSHCTFTGNLNDNTISVTDPNERTIH